MRRPTTSAALSTSALLRKRYSKLRLLGVTSLLALIAPPAFADDIIPPKVYTTTPGGVNVSDGGFIYNVTDLSIGPMQLQRFYVNGSRKPDTPFFGASMSHNWDIFVAPNYTAATKGTNPWPARYKPIVHLGSSASGVFMQPIAAPPVTITANNIDAYTGTLSLSGSDYVYVDKDGTIYNFSAAIPAAGVNGGQRATKITYPDGRVQTLSYNASNQLKLVSDSSGYAIVFDYNASGNVSAACGFDLSQTYVTASSTCAGAALVVNYGYNANLLTTVTDVLGQTTTYTNGVGCIQPPGYSTCKISNTFSGAQVITQTMADGAVWQIGSGDPDAADNPNLMDAPGAVEGQVTDPDGKITSFTFTKTSPYNMTDADGNFTQYSFYGARQFDDSSGLPDADGELMKQVILPEGGQYLAEYNGPRNAISKETLVAKSGSGLANRVKQYTYSSTGCGAPATNQNCAKPLSVVDANGNETDYTYYDFGNTHTEWKPAPTSGAPRPLKIYNYTQLYAYVQNGSGSLVQASTPIWKLTSEVECQSAPGATSPVCDAGSTQITTTYQYGASGTADTLLLRGKVIDSGGLNLRTCYGYDSQGNKIWEKSPRAGASTCQ